MKNNPTNTRKLEHINIIRGDHETDRDMAYFDRIKLQHRALPELDLSKVDTSCTFAGKKLSFPLLISCMTGGDDDLIRTINQNLAIAAEETGVAMGVGSQRVMFKVPGARSSFDLRSHAPTVPLFANLGAVQLNYGFSIKECQGAIDQLDADGLYLHLNPLQEAVQPEGDTNFSGLANKIGELARALSVPVILKEVGAGVSVEDVELVVDKGVKYIDVAGSGGTSWSRIEGHRKRQDQSDNMGMLFQDWGIPTPVALQQLNPYLDRVTLIASGGIRNGIDMAKSVVLGASLCGVASPFLEPAMESPRKVIELIRRLQREYKTAMFLLGAGNFDALHNNTSLIQG